MTNALTTLTRTLAAKLDMGDGADLIHTLKATAFRGEVTDAQMTALLVVANQYGLNPWTKEIYAFPDKQNGIVPVVGVDGWSRIINSHPQFDGIEFHHADQFETMPGGKPAPQWIECHIYRKDRSRPVIVREYLDEVYRAPFKGKYGDVTGPWQTHTKRFLRHKAMIQCARLAFGYGGIYDQDEAERLVDAQPAEKDMGAAEVVPPTLPEWAPEAWADAMPKMLAGIVERGKTVEDALAWLRAKATVTPEQEQQLRDAAHRQAQAQAQPAELPDVPGVDADKLAQQMHSAADLDRIYELGSMLVAINDEAKRLRLSEIFDVRVAELEQAA